MGHGFFIDVYNHSSTEIEFELSNDRCMHLPKNRKIKVSPYSWGEFDYAETSNDTGSGCFASQSKFIISACRTENGKQVKLGNTTYRVSDTMKKRHFGSMLNLKATMAVEAKELFQKKTVRYLAFERVDSYGDLFFNGRGMYVDNTIKSDVRASCINADNYVEVDDMSPTAFINSNKQYIRDVNDSAMVNIISNWVNIGLKVSEVHSFIKSLDHGAKPAASDLKVAWDQFKDTMTGYYNAYKASVSDSDELTVHVHLHDDYPVFHVLFTDSTAKAEEIMLGNFYLPAPPNKKSNFYQNILHLSEEACKKIDPGFHPITTARPGRLARIFNVSQNEYLFACAEKWKDDKTRYVFTLRSKNVCPSDGVWRLIQKEDGKYLIFNETHEEYLIVSDNLFGENRIETYTWRLRNAWDYCNWNIEFLEGPDRVLISSDLRKNQYLYAADYEPFDDIRRRVFVWAPGGPVDQAYWRIEWL